MSDMAEAGRPRLSHGVAVPSWDYGTVRNGFGLVPGGDSGELTADERADVLTLGAAFARKAGGIWLLISGRFADDPDNAKLAENQVRDSCIRVFGYPPLVGEDREIKPERTINVLLDSTGGMLDSGYKIVTFLSRYASELNVYVPRRAKSASTLVALGADHVYLSAFGELGPLDTQILDPRNPAQTISALDCYQSVDYVREFGFSTMSRVLDQLVQRAGGQIALPQLLETASEFALGAITPMLQGVAALDFGGWGRSLKIGERYAEILLQGRGRGGSQIATELVYGYTHHPFPIDYPEARRLGLPVEIMDESMYETAMGVIHGCEDKSFIGFVSEAEAGAVPEAAAQPARQAAKKTGEPAPPRPPAGQGVPPADGARPDGAGQPVQPVAPKAATGETGTPGRGAIS